MPILLTAAFSCEAIAYRKHTTAFASIHAAKYGFILASTRSGLATIAARHPLNVRLCCIRADLLQNKLEMTAT